MLNKEEITKFEEDICITTDDEEIDFCNNCKKIMIRTTDHDNIYYTCDTCDNSKRLPKMYEKFMEKN